MNDSRSIRRYWTWYVHHAVQLANEILSLAGAVLVIVLWVTMLKRFGGPDLFGWVYDQYKRGRDWWAESNRLEKMWSASEKQGNDTLGD